MAVIVEALNAEVVVVVGVRSCGAVLVGMLEADVSISLFME